MKEQTISICSYDVLPDGTVKPSALQRYFQQIALDDVSASGATYPAMREHSMVFVLTKLRMEILRPIRSGDTVTLSTYPYKIEGVNFFRAFEVWRGEELVCCADSRWVLINYARRTILRPSELPFLLTPAMPTVPLPVLPRRITPVRAPESTTARKVLLTEVDENRHLNNCVYSDYLLDHLPADILRNPLRSLCILFDHEAYLGDTVELRYERVEEGYIVDALDRTNEKSCFQALLGLDFSEKL